MPMIAGAGPIGILPAMDVVRFGLGVRAIRRRRAWTQERLAEQAGVSRTAIWRIERGQADRVVVHVLIRVTAALGARIDMRLLWQGEGLDRQGMLHGIDRKGRLARDIARERGWQVASLTRLLVLPDDRTARRRVERHAATYQAALPARTIDVLRWIKRPEGTSHGVLFLSAAHHTSARHRIAGRRSTKRPDVSVTTSGPSR